MSEAPIRIAVVGDGVLAAQAALTLAYGAGGAATVVVVGTGGGRDGLGPFGAAVTALPAWLRSPAIAAHAGKIVAGTAGTSFSLGVAYDGWGGPGGAWFWPFGEIGAPLGGVAFPQLVARARVAGATARLGDYALAALAAQAGRFAFPADDPRSPLSGLAFGQHFPAAALAVALANLAERAGARFVAPLAAVETGADGIAALALADGERIVADLYLDCTGIDALLIGGALAEPWRSAADAPGRIAARLDRLDAAPPPYALHRAHADGWTLETPLDGAIATLTFTTGVAGEGSVAFDPGKRARPWTSNCVALGAAAALVEPTFGTPLLAVQVMLEHLVRLLPAHDGSGVEAAEFNRLALSQHQRLREFTTALWKTNGRVGEPLWDAARTRPAPPELQRRLDLFASRGSVPDYDDELVEPADWIALLDGQGLRQRRLDPLSVALTDEAIARHLAAVRERLVATLRDMPPHAAALAELRSNRR